MILADLGAEVIKVERPEVGDDARHMGPYLERWGAYFVAINRGKRSIVVDLRRKEGKALLLKLVAKSDVFLESFRGGKAASLGLDEETVRSVQPQIIYASLTAYGPRGPEYEKSGYDALLQARTGILSVTGTEEGTPVRAGVSLLDMGSGMWVALGVIAALLERQRSGRGQRVEGSLFQTGVMWLAYHVLARQMSGKDPTPQGTRHPAFAPYGDFPTADGTVLIGVSNDRLFAKLCAALGRVGWVQEPRFATNPTRVQNRPQLEQEMAAVLRERSTAEWLVEFDRHGVPSSPVQNIGQLLNDTQLAAIGQLEQVGLPHPIGASLRLPRLPLELSVSPAAISGPPPQLGEDGKDILQEMGFGQQEIAALIDSGVVGFPPAKEEPITG